MKHKSLTIRLILSVFSIPFVFVLMLNSAHNGDFAFASEENFPASYPFNQTFIISAYYSPLPCQDHYVTGSYQGDIKLNGGGVHGADGTAVYPGMIAAPKSYDFGTKLYIPGIGIVAVHDRGGAIVNANVRNNAFDRLDIWMGYGDEGLRRALNWGRRTVTVTLYGITDSVTEDVQLFGYSQSESTPKQCDQGNSSTAETVEVPEGMFFPLEEGDSGDQVKILQEELGKLSFFMGDMNGIFDATTAHAVFKFQQSQNIVATETDTGAGVFGPKTRQKLSEFVRMRDDTLAMVAQATQNAGLTYVAVVPRKKILLSAQLDPGMTGNEVGNLQQLLKERGYYTADVITNYFGDDTKAALVKFQKDNNIIADESEQGAGRVGPSTLELLNSLS